MGDAAPQQEADIKQSSLGTDAADAEAIDAAVKEIEQGDATTGDIPADEDIKAEPAAEDPKPEEEGIGKAWAAIRKKEQRFLRAQKEVAAEREKASSLSKQLEEQLALVRRAQDDLTKDPLATLEKMGITFDDLAKRAIHGRAPIEEVQRRADTETKSEIHRLREEQEQLKQLIQRQSNDKLIGEYRSQIKSTLDTDKFELLRAYDNAEDEVFEFASKYAAKHKEALTVEQAAEKLQVELQKQLTRMGSHKAVRSLLMSSEDAASRVAGAPSKAAQSPGRSPKTLTNNLAATPPTDDPDWDKLSEEEQIRRALLHVHDG